MADITQAILAINPNAIFSVNAEDYDQITWETGTAVISKADIQAKQAELKTAYDALDYSRNRAVAYPELKEQLDLLYKDMAADKGDKTGEWFKAVKKVKDDNPKE
jgi:hypothetical protein